MLPPAGRGILIALLFAFASSTPCLRGQSGSTPMQQPSEPVRYHFGDDPDGKLGWANPALDDSAWPVEPNGRMPGPASSSPDGIEWRRIRVPVPKDASGALAIRVIDGGLSVISFEIFVNGQQVARRGSFPHRQEPAESSAGSVFDLPQEIAPPGTSALIAYRIWIRPLDWHFGNQRNVRFEIGQRSYEKLVDHADRLTALLRIGPVLAIYSFMAILGVCLLVFWRWTGGRELLLFSGFLLFTSLHYIHQDTEQLGIHAIPRDLDWIFFFVLQIAEMAVMVEFVWAIHLLRARILKRIVQTSIVILNACLLYAFLTTAASAPIPWILGAAWPSGQVFNLIIIGTNLRPLLTLNKTWPFGLALAIFPVAAMLSSFGINTNMTIGHFSLSLHDLGNFAASLALFVMLGQRAWKAWRVRDEFRAEFETARVMQQQLVAPPGDIPGFKTESVYQPARQVGGDFFRVIPELGGGVLVVVGDVSGKGLGAAMTVSAVIGALRCIPPVSPSWILNALNCGLVGELRGGFVTCCVARIGPDGAGTMANAGHLAPYLGGVELPVPAGLPMGITIESSYEEISFQLLPGQHLTFLSDGVVEARNAAGELFGFERTRAISTESAEKVAQAAQDFGQDDDITVLTLARLAV